ncbi:MAG: SIMPL domain-containing protein [Bacteroidota bacterium]
MKNIILILLTTLSINGFAQFGGKNFIDQSYIEVTGKAEIKVKPDQIFLRVIISEKDIKNKTLEEMEKLMMQQLEDIGIDISNDLVIKDMASNFKDYWLKSSRTKSVKEYEVLVSDAKTAGQVFQTLESIKISNISIDRMENSEIQKHKMKVKLLAIKAAKEKADALTEAIDQKIGKAIHIQELNQSTQGQLATLSNIAITNYQYTKGKDVEIQFDEIKLEYSILTRFEIME